MAWASARSPANSESSGRASLSIQGAAIARGNVHQDVGSSGSSTMTCLLQPRWRRVVIRGPPRSTRSHRSTAIGSPEDGLQEVSLVIDQRLQEQLPLTRGQVLRVSPEASTPPSVFSMPQPDTSAASYSNFLRYPSIMADEHRSHSDISSLPRARSINTATLQMDTRTPRVSTPKYSEEDLEELMGFVADSRLQEHLSPITDEVLNVWGPAPSPHSQYAMPAGVSAPSSEPPSNIPTLPLSSDAQHPQQGISASARQWSLMTPLSQRSSRTPRRASADDLSGMVSSVIPHDSVALNPGRFNDSPGIGLLSAVGTHHHSASAAEQGFGSMGQHPSTPRLTYNPDHVGFSPDEQAPYPFPPVLSIRSAYPAAPFVVDSAVSLSALNSQLLPTSAFRSLAILNPRFTMLTVPPSLTAVEPNADPWGTVTSVQGLGGRQGVTTGRIQVNLLNDENQSCRGINDLSNYIINYKQIILMKPSGRSRRGAIHRASGRCAPDLGGDPRECQHFATITVSPPLVPPSAQQSHGHIRTRDKGYPENDCDALPMYVNHPYGSMADEFETAPNIEKLTRETEWS